MTSPGRDLDKRMFSITTIRSQHLCKQSNPKKHCAIYPEVDRRAARLHKRTKSCFPSTKCSNNERRRLLLSNLFTRVYMLHHLKQTLLFPTHTRTLTQITYWETTQVGQADYPIQELAENHESMGTFQAGKR